MTQAGDQQAGRRQRRRAAEGPAPLPARNGSDDTHPDDSSPAAEAMTPEDDAQRVAERLIVAEACEVARGWRFLTVDNLAPHGDADPLLYERVLDTFDEAVGDRECRHRGRRNAITFGIRGEGAERRIAWLRARLEKLKPPLLPGCGSWDIRDGAR